MFTSSSPTPSVAPSNRTLHSHPTPFFALPLTMVLLTSNMKRVVDNENTPPPHKAQGTNKPLASHNRTSNDAARRRRARNNGGTHTPRYVVEQAKRRSATKSPTSSVRIDVSVLPRTPSPDKDVLMQEPTQSPVHPSLPTVPITLPRNLARPNYREISKDAIAAVDPKLSDVNMDYILDGLEVLGPRMLNVLSNVQARPPKNILPKELSVLVNDTSSDLPTHMFAVYSRRTNIGSRRRVTLFPVHNIIFSTQCANLPNLPTPPKPTPPIDSSESFTITIPVVPLSIPSPQTFPQLSAYLYTRCTSDLMVYLLPPCPQGCPPPSVDDTDPITLQQHARRMAETYTVQFLLAQAMTINGFWRNVCALGIFDLDLWDSMDVAWEIVLNALAISTGNVDALSPAL